MALTKVIGDGTGTLNSATVSGNATIGGTLGVTGITDSSVGQSFIPEFISNLFLAGNTASACELTGCFTNTHQIYRLVGQVGCSHGNEGNTRFTFLSGTNTELTSGYYGAGRALDDSQTEVNSAEADGSAVTININQSSTGTSIVDMHFYRQQHAYQILGMAG